MNENRINIFKCFIYSITGFDKYRVLVRQSMGKAVGYLILLGLLLSAVVFIPVYTIANQKFDTIMKFVTENVPDFNLSDGRLEVYGEMPLVIEDDVLPIVIDTTPGAEKKILNEYDSVILLTQDKMVMKNFVNMQEYPLSAFEGIEVNKDRFIKVMPMFRAYMTLVLIFMGIFTGIFFVAGKFISALVVSLIGLIANSSSKTNLSYKSIFKISIFSMTLPLIISTVINALMLNIPFLSVLFYIGSGVYVFGAINGIRKYLEAGGNDWDLYDSDTFNGRDHRNNDYQNFNYGSGNPTQSGQDYNYDNRRYIGNNNENNKTGSNNAANSPANDPAANPAANDQPENKDSDEK